MRGGGHVVLVIDAGAPVAPVLASVRRFAPDATHLHVVSLNGDPDQAQLQALYTELEPTTLELTFEASFDAAQVAQAAHEHRAALVVVGPWPSLTARARALAVLQLVARYGVDVLAVPGNVVPGLSEPVADGPTAGVTSAQSSTGSDRPVAVTLDPRSDALMETTSRVRALPGVERVTLLLRAAWTEAEELQLRALLPTHALELVALAELDPLTIAKEAQARGAELLVVPSVDVSAATLMSSIFSGRALEDVPLPVLLLHHDAASTGLFSERLAATDVIRVPGERMRVLLERSTALGRSELDPTETFFIVGAEERGPLPHERGVVKVPDDWVPPDAVALALCSTKAPTPVASARLLSPTGRPSALLDSRTPNDALVDVEAFAADHTLVVVRLRADESLESVRERFDAAVPWGGPVAVLDASALLGDAGAGDVPGVVDGMRLQRLGLQLQLQGVPAVACIVAERPELSSPFVTTWTLAQLKVRTPTLALSAPYTKPEGEEGRWLRLCEAGLVEGHHVELELENEAARRRLLASIAEAKERVHWQSFMVDLDPVSEEVAEAFRQAAERGVKVRVLVDALYSLHDVFGAKNPILTKLAQTPGVEVRAAHALSGVPGVLALKRRNHRKLTCIDRTLATVSGRNLGAPYYRGFGELQITAQTSFHDVPWLDAGAVLRGPLVESVDRAFLADWVAAGGTPFEVSPSPPAGSMACRLVLHEGLGDTHSLDSQLELIRSAKQRVVMVNTFPLVLELQQALIAAVRRGLWVQCLIGSVRPVWGDDRPFGGGTLRAIADELVRARLLPVLQAGAEGFLFTVPVEGLGPVFTHVHAKLFVRDDDLVSVGSANTDVTSAYWESEAQLLVHDRDFARATLSELDILMQTGRPIDAASASWREVAARREWLSRNWPSIIP